MPPSTRSRSPGWPSLDTSVETERRRSRTDRAVGYTTALVLKSCLWLWESPWIVRLRSPQAAVGHSAGQSRVSDTVTARDLPHRFGRMSAVEAGPAFDRASHRRGSVEPALELSERDQEPTTATNDPELSHDVLVEEVAADPEHLGCLVWAHRETRKPPFAMALRRDSVGLAHSVDGNNGPLLANCGRRDRIEQLELAGLRGFDRHVPRSRFHMFQSA